MFTTFSIAGINLRNPTVYPPLTTCLAESDGKISNRMFKYTRSGLPAGQESSYILFLPVARKQRSYRFHRTRNTPGVSIGKKEAKILK